MAVRHELAPTAYAPTEAVCRVCGTTVGDEPILCPECLTPHHRDCWEYNGGCATYACPAGHQKAMPRPVAAGGAGPAASANAAPALPRPDKIPFPVLQAGTFLGYFFVTWPTAVITVVAEVLGLINMGVDMSAALFWFTVMACAILWAAVTAEVYNIDVKGRRITRSKLVAGHEIAEWPICNLEQVAALELLRCKVEGRTCRKLICRLYEPTLLADQVFDLTPPYEPGSPDDFAMDAFIYRLESGSNVTVLVAPSLTGTTVGTENVKILPSPDSGDD